MSEIRYRKCDICGHTISEHEKFFVAKFKSFFKKNRMDICEKCKSKIEKLEYDKCLEAEIVGEIVHLGVEKYKDNQDLCSAFLEGVEVTVNKLLSHNQLKYIK